MCDSIRVLIVALAGALGADAVAQSSRVVDYNLYGGSCYSRDAVYIVRAETESRIRVNWTTHGGVAQSKVLDLGLSQLGSIVNVREYLSDQGLPSGPCSKILVCGAAVGGEGRVSLLVWDGATYSEHSHRDFPGRIFTGVTYSVARQRMYLLDSSQGEILQGTLVPAAGNATVVLPSTLTVLVGQQELPELAHASTSMLLGDVESRGQACFVYGAWPLPRVHGYSLVTDAVSGPSVTRQLGQWEGPAIRTLPLLDGMTQVLVGGRAGMTVYVSSALNGSILGSGVVGAGGDVTVTLSAPLSLGDIYECYSSSGESADYFATPMKSWGVSDLMPSGFRIVDSGDGPAMLAELGSHDMSPTLTLAPPSPPPASATTWSAWLLVGTENDVVPAGGGRFALLTPTSIPAIGYWDPSVTSATGFGLAPMPVSTDPTLAGVVVCFQWLVVEGTEIYLSNVAGYMIRGDEWVAPGSDWEIVLGPDEAALGGAPAARSVVRTLREPQPLADMNNPVIQQQLLLWSVRNGARPLPMDVMNQMLRMVGARGR